MKKLSIIFHQLVLFPLFGLCCWCMTLPAISISKQHPLGLGQMDLSANVKESIMDTPNREGVEEEGFNSTLSFNFNNIPTPAPTPTLSSKLEYSTPKITSNKISDLPEFINQRRKSLLKVKRRRHQLHHINHYSRWDNIATSDVDTNGTDRDVENGSDEDDYDDNNDNNEKPIDQRWQRFSFNFQRARSDPPEFMVQLFHALSNVHSRQLKNTVVTSLPNINKQGENYAMFHPLIII